MDQSDEDEVQEPELQLFKDKEHVIDIYGQLIIKTSADPDTQMTEDQKVEFLDKVITIHLEHLNIKKIENLDGFIQLQVLFLQHNNISVIEGLDTLINLEYLSLNHNSIKVLEGLKRNKSLGYLDIRDNPLKEINYDQLTKTIEILHISLQPVPDQLIGHLTKIEEINGQPVSREQQFKTMNIFPEDLKLYQDKINKRKALKKKMISLYDYHQNPQTEKYIEDDDEMTDKYCQHIRDNLHKQLNRIRDSTQKMLNSKNDDLKDYQSLQQKIRNEINQPK